MQSLLQPGSVCSSELERDGGDDQGGIISLHYLNLNSKTQISNFNLKISERLIQMIGSKMQNLKHQKGTVVMMTKVADADGLIKN